jgi:hypothetical protein
MARRFENLNDIVFDNETTVWKRTASVPPGQRVEQDHIDTLPPDSLEHDASWTELSAVWDKLNLEDRKFLVQLAERLVG